MPRFLVVSACLFVLSLLSAGCDSGPRVVPVSGIVRIDGQPLTTGFVQVVPKDTRAASGKIGPDGRFRLTTMQANDGCAVGAHAAAVIGLETLGPSSQKWHAPQKYADVEQSGLTVNIIGPTDDLSIDLTWAGGKPFVQTFGKE